MKSILEQWFDFEVVLLCIESVHKCLKGQDMSDISLVFNMIFTISIVSIINR